MEVFFPKHGTAVVSSLWPLTTNLTSVLVVVVVGKDRTLVSAFWTALRSTLVPHKTRRTDTWIERLTKPNDDNDNDTQRSPANNCQWPGLTGMSEGVMTPRKRNLLKTMGLALLARCALAHC